VTLKIPVPECVTPIAVVLPPPVTAPTSDAEIEPEYVTHEPETMPLITAVVSVTLSFKTKLPPAVPP
jgi:hypothetical protein